MYTEDGRVFIEDDDQCIICENYARGTMCPLIEALGSGVVVLEDSMSVVNCGFYKEFRRTLHLVKDENK